MMIKYTIHDSVAKGNNRFVHLQGSPAATVIKKIREHGHIKLHNDQMIDDLLVYIHEINED